MIATLLALLLATVNSPYSPPSYACDGVTAAFTVPFPYQASSDLKITSTTAAGVASVLTQGTDWSVNLSSTSSTATLTLTSPGTKCPSGSVLKVERGAALTQPKSFRGQTTYDPSVHEAAYDRDVMLIQQVNDKAVGTGTPASTAYVDQAVANTLTGGTVVQPITWSLTGDGTTTVFSIPNAAVSSPDLYIVTIDGVFQRPTTDYTVSSASGTVTFASAPALNGVISVRSTGYARALSVGDATSVLATGTSVPLDLAHRFGQVPTIKDFGALCNGVTDDGPAISAAIAATPSTGGTVVFPCDATIITPLAFSVPNGKVLVIDLQGHKLTLKHTSGAGVTFSTASFFRQPLTISHGTVSYGGSTAGITGLLFSQVIQLKLEDVLFTGFTGTNQIVVQLDNTQDSTLDGVNFVNNTGTGTICLNLTNNANANKYSNVQFQSCYQAVAISNGASGSWFSDCLIQSSTGPNAVTVQSLTAHANHDITDTNFNRCWFENNGDGTANSTSISFTADAGRTITDTSVIDSHFNGNTTGTLGVAFRFAGAGNPSDFSFYQQGGYYAGYASLFSGLRNGGGGVALMANDRTGTLTADLDLGSVNHGVRFAPQGSAKKYQIYGGFPSDNDGSLIFKDLTGAAQILLYNGGTWQILKAAYMSAAFGMARVVLTYSATIATDASLGNSFSITATNGTAFTISNPTNLSTGQRVLYTIRNTSGGALGVVTWGATFKLAAFTNPATGNSRSIEFVYDGTNLVQLYQSAADVPN